MEDVTRRTELMTKLYVSPGGNAQMTIVQTNQSAAESVAVRTRNLEIEGLGEETYGGPIPREGR